MTRSHTPSCAFSIKTRQIHAPAHFQPYTRVTRPGLALGYKTRGGQSEIYFLTFLELVSRIRNEGPWVWLDYRQDRCLFSTHIVAPCFLTFSHRVRFKTFEGGFDAPRFLSSELFVGIRVDRVRSAPHPGAR